MSAPPRRKVTYSLPGNLVDSIAEVVREGAAPSYSAFVEDAYVFLECEHFKTIDGFGQNSLITGKIVAAQADVAALRTSDDDEQEAIRQAPLFAYLPPNRFATIDTTHTFPFPADMKK